MVLDLLACPFRWWLRRFAAKIEAEFPGPYPVGTIGAAWRRFAALARAL